MYLAIYDDQIEDLKLLSALLDRWQRERQDTLRFKTFRSAAELLDAAEKETFSLYLLDVMMPGVDGLEAAREIRSRDDTAEIVFFPSSPGGSVRMKRSTSCVPRSVNRPGRWTSLLRSK